MPLNHQQRLLLLPLGRAALCELGGEGLHTEPKAIMRDYEYDEEAHPRVMLSNHETAERKGCQDVDRDEDIDEGDTMLTMEEELLIEQSSNIYL